MAVPLLAIGLGISAAAGAAKSIFGAKQAAEGRRLAARNTRPEFDIAKEYFDNQALAANLAQSGLPASSLDYYTRNLERGLSSSTGAMLQAGGGPNAIAGAFDQYSQGLSGVAAADAQAKTQNIRYLMDRNKDIAEQRTMQWSLNQYEPYKDRALTASQLQAQGTENLFGGISQVGSSLASMSKAGLYSGNSSSVPAAGSPTGSQIAQMNARTDYQLGSALGNPYLSGQDASMMQRQQLIDDSLQGMDNSPYRDLIQERLRRDYGIYNSQNIG